MRRPAPSLAVHLSATGTLCAVLGCASPTVKPEAFDASLLARDEAPFNQFEPDPELDDEVITRPTIDWLAPEPGEVAFAGLRDGDGARVRYCVVLGIDADADSVVLLPLADDETSLDASQDADRMRELRALVAAFETGERPEDAVEVTLEELIRDRRLAPPLPTPRRVLAVAANFPSHLQVDLSIGTEQIVEIAKTPPRLFQKYPPIAPPGSDLELDDRFEGVIGPFDEVRFPHDIALPQDRAGVTNWVHTALDYEGEIGFVIGKDLTWAAVESMTDAEIYAAVAGYVLVSDVKARNPQVFERALHRDDPPESSGRYMTGVANVDLLFGHWDESSCAWWSYAAGFGDFAALGPWFVPGEFESMPDRALVSARSYGPPPRGGHPIPDGRRPSEFYLRQCALVTERIEHTDAVLWTIPRIIRGVLEPDGALALGTDPQRLTRGDVIALGTPGGIVLTVRNRTLYRILDWVLFWWSPLDWHDAFFGKDADLYLRDADAVLFWGQGLGFQQLTVQSVPPREVGEVEPEPGTEKPEKAQN